MGGTMAALMSSPDVGLPEDTVSVCLAGKLATELTASDALMYELEAQIENLEQASRESQTGTTGKRRRANQKPEVVKLREQAKAQAAVSDEIRERMISTTIDIKVRGKDSGAWRDFCSAHPPRDKDEDRGGYVRDLRLSMMNVNVDDLVQAAGDWVVLYGDDEPTNEYWEFVLANAVPGDLDRLAKTIARLHEGGMDLGKSRSDWHEARRTEAASK